MSSQLRVDKILPVDGAPTGGGGGIVQIVSSTKTGRQESTSATFADVTDMSVSITPKFSSSKMHIAVNTHVGGVSAAYIGFKVLRDSTVVTQGTHPTGSRTPVSFGGRIDADYDNYMMAFNFLDSPSTTSATTYKVQFASIAASRKVVINGTGDDADANYTLSGTSTITVMEVSA